MYLHVVVSAEIWQSNTFRGGASVHKLFGHGQCWVEWGTRQPGEGKKKVNMTVHDSNLT